MRQNPERALTRYAICELACKAYIKGLCPVNLISAFKKAGILPLDKTVICDYIFAPSFVTVSNCDGKYLPKDSQTKNSQNKPNNATEKELLPTVNNLLITKQIVRPSKKTQTQRKTKRIVS